MGRFIYRYEKKTRREKYADRYRTINIWIRVAKMANDRDRCM
jgi:hypothetical protein